MGAGGDGLRLKFERLDAAPPSAADRVPDPNAPVWSGLDYPAFWAGRVTERGHRGVRSSRRMTEEHASPDAVRRHGAAESGEVTTHFVTILLRASARFDAAIALCLEVSGDSFGCVWPLGQPADSHGILLDWLNRSMRVRYRVTVASAARAAPDQEP